MSHSGHSMDMDGAAAECKVDMLWNWNTIDACFLSSSWRITTQGAFAATCIGVILLVILVEFLRRLGKEYDALLMRQFHRRAAAYGPTLAAQGCAGGVAEVVPRTMTFRVSLVQQLTRALIHAATFAGAYIIMLLAMYFNGYIIICIFIGAGLGKFLCDWLEVKVDLATIEDAGKVNKGIEETTICCG
jgi:copper transporter 1